MKPHHVCPLLFPLLTALSGFAAAAADGPAAKKILVYNEDNSAYFQGVKYGGDMTEAGLRGYVRAIAAGGHVTHFFMCPNAMRASFASSVLEPIWKCYDEPGIQCADWPRNARLLHERGIDPYAVWTDECRRRGVSPWLSVRMNDAHGTPNPTNYLHSSRWRNNPRLRRMQTFETGHWADLAFDFSHREVKDLAVAFIRELLGRYDVDGIELDWMRFPHHLPHGRERASSHHLDEVVRKARALVDDASRRRGRSVKLGVRIASRPEIALSRGTDFETWAKEGLVDWIVPCNFYRCSDLALPYAEWRRRLDAIAPSVTIVPGTDNGIVENRKRRPLTLGEYALFADRVYKAGAPGVYLFNLFDHPKESGVWQAVVGQGLTPGFVRTAARTVTPVDCRHD